MKSSFAQSPVMANLEHVKLLQSGVGEWNTWRMDNPDVQMDLRKADLRRASLRRVNFDGVDLSGAILTGADLSHSSMNGANLSRAVLNGANLMYASLIMTDFTEAGMSSAQFPRNHESFLTTEQIDVIRFV